MSILLCYNPLTLLFFFFGFNGEMRHHLAHTVKKQKKTVLSSTLSVQTRKVLYKYRAFSIYNLHYGHIHYTVIRYNRCGSLKPRSTHVQGVSCWTKK